MFQELMSDLQKGLQLTLDARSEIVHKGMMLSGALDTAGLSEQASMFLILQIERVTTKSEFPNEEWARQYREAADQLLEAMEVLGPFIADHGNNVINALSTAVFLGAQEKLAVAAGFAVGKNAKQAMLGLFDDMLYARKYLLDAAEAEAEAAEQAKAQGLGVPKVYGRNGYGFLQALHRIVCTAFNIDGRTGLDMVKEFGAKNHEQLQVPSNKSYIEKYLLQIEPKRPPKGSRKFGEFFPYRPMKP